MQKKIYIEKNEKINKFNQILFLLIFLKYKSDLVKHYNCEKKNKYKYNVEIRILIKKNIYNLLNHYLSENN